MPMIETIANFCLEYIGQLEGEIATKQSEADELRVKNQELMAENTRLTDLTRMLLSSPAFSTFLNDLSGADAPASLPDLSQSQSQRAAMQTQSNAPRKDVNPNQVNAHQAQDQRQNDMHVGLTMIPEESSYDYTSESLNTGYTESMDFGGLYDAQVYAVTSLPQGPAVDSSDFTMLHGKPSNFVGSCPDIGDAKDEPTTFEHMPSVPKMETPEPVETPHQEDNLDTTDPAFALFVDQPPSTLTPTPVTIAPEDRIFGDIECEKAFGRVEIVIPEDTAESAEVSSATLERFERLCSRLEVSSARIAAVTGRL